MGKASLILSCLQAPTGPRLGSPRALTGYSNYPSYSVLSALLLVYSVATHTLHTDTHACFVCFALCFDPFLQTTPAICSAS